jgi:hypothetical protein
MPKSSLVFRQTKEDLTSPPHPVQRAPSIQRQANLFLPIVTRSNKANDRNHSAIADGTATAEERLPRYFAKSGYVDADPKGVKKQGGGKGNW